ncbi:MAG TPA: hypothetical protein VFG39_06435 [Balneolaceae bacterium]|nr:hypothetical protein [Balneolaceae bacterium]
MFKRRIKSYTGFGLLLLMSISLTITTLHSHHHLDLNHPSNLADTGSCITADTTLCPICGISRAETPSFSPAVKTVFRAEEIVIDEAPSAISISLIANKGRSPPFIA